MTVFVGVPMWPFRGMMMCHMVADTERELDNAAAAIGVARRWKQYNPDKKPGTVGALTHYDIAKSKRKLAIEYGAVALDTLEDEARVLERLARGRAGLTGRKLANTN